MAETVAPFVPAVENSRPKPVDVTTASTMIASIPDDGATTPKSELKENLAADESLRDSSTSSAELSAMSFESMETLSPAKLTNVPPSLHDPVPVSSASSTCTRESDAGALSDAEGVVVASHSLSSGFASPSSSRFYHVVSEKLNAKVSTRKTSRQGRSNQRWVTENNEHIRLVTGAVPILRGGKVLFVSSRRKPEWIIPKGGWESDEAMEESAIRECFEEAGVLGVLGRKLSERQHETRKAKKRRLELETMEREAKMESSSSETKAKTDEATEETETKAKAKTDEATEEKDTTTAEAAAVLSPQAIARIRADAEAASKKQDKHHQDDKTSVASATHSQVRMTLFPLYVQKVLDDWPESGRFRKAVDIDTAIEMLDNRPELKAVLQEVKEKGLHYPQA